MARVHLIYKNPRYKVVQKDNKYLLIDLEQHWYSYLLPMLNWIIPVEYTELTYEEYNNMNIISNKNQNAYAIFAGGIGLIVSICIRKIMFLMDIYLSTTYIILIFLIGLIFVIWLRRYISKRLKMVEFEMKKKKKLMLFPTFKNLIIVLFGFYSVFLLFTYVFYTVLHYIRK